MHNNYDDDEEEQGNEIEKIVNLIENRCSEIFIDQFNEINAFVYINDHFETLDIDEYRFEKLVTLECYKNKIKINKDKIKNIVDIIKSKVEFDIRLNRRILNLRIAKKDSNYYYDLVNTKWEIIQIRQDGWNVVDNENALFKRYKDNMEQVNPNKNYSQDCIDRFLELVNLHSKKDKLLFLVYLVSLFIPDIAKPILLIYGSKGAAKTTTFELIKNIVDPSVVETLSFPKETNDLIQILSHNYVSYFDNISNISNYQSDLLCRAVTGTGSSKRKNYTDDDVFIYKFKRALGINGINIASAKPDFLDRCLILEVNRISKEKRRKEEDVKADFKRLLPDVLGWIFDVLVKVLRYKNNENADKIKLKEYPRMADFAEYGEIIARCIGYKENEFIETYFDNIEIQNDEVIESSIVASILIDFMEDRDIWEGPMSMLYSTLSNFAEDRDSSLRKTKLWPNASNALSRKINELRPSLKEKGIDIQRLYDNKRKGRQIKIINLGKISSLSSYRSSYDNINSDYDDNNTTSDKENTLFRSETNAENQDDKNNHQDNNNSNVLTDDLYASYQKNNDICDTCKPTIISVTPIAEGNFQSNNTSNEQQPSICDIANRMYEGSDTWLCKTCNQIGDKWYILNHYPSCKRNKKQ
jgi:hypothetical protein